MTQTQDIIRTANQEGLGRPNALTFLFLRDYGSNKINKTQDELAADTGIDNRTLRSHLYKLTKSGWIEYSGKPNGKNIILKRFRH